MQGGYVDVAEPSPDGRHPRVFASSRPCWVPRAPMRFAFSRRLTCRRSGCFTRLWRRPGYPGGSAGH